MAERAGSFQWRLDGEHIAHGPDFSGTDTDVLTVVPSFRTVGAYDVVGSNDAGSVTSDEAILAVRQTCRRPDRPGRRRRARRLADQRRLLLLPRTVRRRLPVSASHEAPSPRETGHGGEPLAPPSATSARPVGDRARRMRHVKARESPEIRPSRGRPFDCSWRAPTVTRRPSPGCFRYTSDRITLTATYSPATCSRGTTRAACALLIGCSRISDSPPSPVSK